MIELYIFNIFIKMKININFIFNENNKIKLE